MNKTRRKILRCLYEANKTRTSIYRPLNYIKDNTKIDIRTIERETDYLSQKGYIEKKLITTPDISAYSCKITAHGIDEIEKNKFFKFPFTKTIIWIVSVGIPLLGFYLDFFGLKTKFLAHFTKTPQASVTKEQSTLLQPTQSDADFFKQVQVSVAHLTSSDARDFIINTYRNSTHKVTISQLSTIAGHMVSSDICQTIQAIAPHIINDGNSQALNALLNHMRSSDAQVALDILLKAKEE